MTEMHYRRLLALYPLAPGQWAALVLVPVAAFLVGAELTRRYEAVRFRAAGAGTK